VAISDEPAEGAQTRETPRKTASHGHGLLTSDQQPQSEAYRTEGERKEIEGGTDSPPDRLPKELEKLLEELFPTDTVRRKRYEDALITALASGKPADRLVALLTYPPTRELVAHYAYGDRWLDQAEREVEKDDAFGWYIVQREIAALARELQRSEAEEEELLRHLRFAAISPNEAQKAIRAMHRWLEKGHGPREDESLAEWHQRRLHELQKASYSAIEQFLLRRRESEGATG